MPKDLYIPWEYSILGLEDVPGCSNVIDGQENLLQTLSSSSFTTLIHTLVTPKLDYCNAF